MKKYFLILIAVIFIATGCEEMSIDNSDSQEVQEQVPKPAEPLKILNTTSTKDLEYKTVKLEDEQDGYYYEIGYPDFSGGDDLISKKINQDVYDHVQTELNNFLNEFKASEHEYDPGPWFLSISYYVNRNDNAFVSIIMQASVYMGGAHPNSYFNTFNYNLEESGKLMTIEDVFNPMAEKVDIKTGKKRYYLDFISDYTINELMSRDLSDEDWVMDGAGPSSENFKNFHLTQDRIIFIFDPYQVAPYAAGPQEVFILFEDLADYLKAYAF
ncbi:MAG: DUF3298 and DUF4163 domain-containing protein [Patescibacteria group bacterium]